MMNDIMNISGVSCYERDGVAYLCLEDIARGLGFTEVAASGNECIRWRTVRKYLVNLGIATCCDGCLPEFIPENIFYRLAMKAKNETAEKFQALVADEIIPSIRKHGAYITPNKLSEMLRTPEAVFEMLSALSEEQKKNAELTEQNTALTAENERLTPLAEFADAVISSDTAIMIGMLATLLQQNGLDIGQNRLFARLRKEGYLIDQKGDRWNTPTQRAMALDLFKVDTKLVKLPDGKSWKITYTTRVTPKGQKYFIEKYVFNREVQSLDSVAEPA